MEFAKLLVQVQPDLQSILEDEQVHVAFFEQEVKKVLAQSGATAEGARQSARAWWRRLPLTVDRYLEGDSLTPFRSELKARIMASIFIRFQSLTLLDGRTE